MASHINSLPGEVLARIFSFLDSKAKLRASSTCRHWLRVINEYPEVLEDVRVRFFACSLKHIFEIFSTMIRNFCNFRFENADIDRNCFLFLEKFGPQFRRLSFKYCTVLIDFKHHKKLDNCTNLLELNVRGSNVLAMFSRLPGLKRFYFQTHDEFSERVVAQMDGTLPLTLTDFALDYDFLRGRGSEDMFVTITPDMRDFIQIRRSNLRCLNLNAFRISDDDMAVLSGMEGLRLRGLKLTPRNPPDPASIGSFCNNQRWIVDLDLCAITNLDDATVVEICTTLPLLVALRLHSCVPFDKSVSAIFTKLSRLRKLDLSKCINIGKGSFRKAFDQLSCKELEVVDLCLTSIDELLLAFLIPLVPKLRKVVLCCVYDLDDSMWADSMWIKSRVGMVHIFEKTPIFS